MLHEDKDKLNGSVVDLERETQHLRNMETQWSDLLTKCSHTPVNWTKLHKDTTYLNAHECLKLGLIDEII